MSKLWDKLFYKEKPSRYRIRKIGDVFYPEYDTQCMWGWEVIVNGGKDLAGFEYAVSYGKGCNSEEAAGVKINNHSLLFSEGEVIWEG